jgi:phosphoglycolate phosphatase (TIGR01487 family)
MDFAESRALADRLPATLPPLALDIDGTLTDDDQRLDPRIFPVCRAWPAPLVVATGKSMPYPIALCEFLGIEPLVVAENGGVVLVGHANDLRFEGHREAAAAVLAEYRAQGYDVGWGAADLANRWRETELTVSCDSPLAPLEAIADDHGLEVVDTGYAYHVKSPDVTKGTGLQAVAETLDRDPSSFAAIGDSENDAATFELVEQAVAVANADETARATADHVTDAAYADGFLEAVAWLCDRAETN